MTRDSRDSDPNRPSRSGMRARRQARAAAPRRPALLPGVCARKRAALAAAISSLYPQAGVIGRRAAAGAADDLDYAAMMRGVRDEATRLAAIDHIAWRLMNALHLQPDEEPRREAIVRDLATRWADHEFEAVAAVRDALGPEADFDRVLARSVVSYLDRHLKVQSVIGASQRCAVEGVSLVKSASEAAKARTAPGEPSPDAPAQGRDVTAPIAPSPPPGRSLRRTKRPHPPQPGRPRGRAPKPGHAPQPPLRMGAPKGGDPMGNAAAEASCAGLSRSSAPAHDAALAARDGAPAQSPSHPGLAAPGRFDEPDQPNHPAGPGRRPGPAPRSTKAKNPSSGGADGAPPSPETTPGPAEAPEAAARAPAATLPRRLAAAPAAEGGPRQPGPAPWVQRLSQPARPARWSPRRRPTFD
ncbi:hypothetical protein [Alsobacter sp. SYSU BS001988]